MDSDLLGTIVLDGRRLGACYFPALPEAGHLLEAGDARYLITAVVWVAPALDVGRGLAEVRVEVRPVRIDTDG
jgi:hypothetical protein